MKQQPQYQNMPAVLNEHLLNAIEHPIFWLDCSTTLLGCNQKYLTFINASSAHEIIGRKGKLTPWELINQQISEYSKQAIKNKLPVTFEQQILMQTKNPRHLFFEIRPLTNHLNTVTGVLILCKDNTQSISDQQRITALEHKIQQDRIIRSEFLKNISHDMKTPLSGIISLSQSLHNRMHKQRDKEDTKDLYSASKELLNLINQILEVTGLETQEHTLKSANFTTQDLINKLHNLLMPLAKEKSIDLQFSHDNLAAQPVIAQFSLLHRVLLNLATNAIKFTHQGSVRISSQIKKHTHQHCQLIFQVTDTGIGIAKEHHERIFQAYQKGSPSYEGKYPGLGLGLYLVKEFINRQNGSITLTSEPGKGSQFTVYVPAKLTHTITKKQKNNQKKNISNIIKNQENSPARVLLVEDTPIAQKAATLRLQEMGCIVEVAKTGKQALKKIRNQHFDIIYMDIGLPDITGIEATKEIRAWQLKHQQKPIPIIALTAHIDEQDAKLCIAAGMNDVLHKPLLDQFAMSMHAQYIE